MGRERVPRAVRVRDEPRRRARVEPQASSREEEGVLRAACERRPRLAHISGHPVRRLLAERHDALLTALPAYADELLLEVHVYEVEVDRLAASQARRVDELDERAVPKGERPGAFESIEHRLDLV